MSLVGSCCLPRILLGTFGGSGFAFAFAAAFAFFFFHAFAHLFNSSCQVILHSRTTKGQIAETPVKQRLHLMVPFLALQAISSRKHDVQRELPTYRCLNVKCLQLVDSKRTMPGSVNPCAEAYVMAEHSLRHLTASSWLNCSPVVKETLSLSQLSTS